MLIAFSGKMGSGKDTSADYLVTQFNFKKIAFADKLKKICKNYRNDSQFAESYHSNDIAASLFPEAEVHLDKKIADLFRKVQPNGWPHLSYEDLYINKTDISRACLQGIGDGMRHILPNKEHVWIEYLVNFINNNPEKHDYAISDLRYINEAEMIRANKGIIIRIDRPADRTENLKRHVSEVELDDYPFDYYIKNTSDKSALYKQLDNIIREITKQ